MKNCIWGYKGDFEKHFLKVNMVEMQNDTIFYDPLMLLKVAARSQNMQRLQYTIFT